MQFKVNSAQAKTQPAVQPELQDVFEAQEGMMNAYNELLEISAEAHQLDGMITKINCACQAIETLGADAIKFLNCDKGLENFLGVEESKITVQVATEGFMESIKAGFEKLAEWIVKAFTAIRNFIGKVFNTTGHQMRFIQENIDKIDFNAEIDGCLMSSVGTTWCSATEGILKAAVTPITDLISMMSSDAIKDVAGDTISSMEKVSNASHGLLIYDKDSGEITINYTSQKKNASLSECGWSKSDILAIETVKILPKLLADNADRMFTVAKTITSFKNKFLSSALGGDAGADDGTYRKAINDVSATANTMAGGLYTAASLVVRLHSELSVFISKVYTLAKKGANASNAQA